MATAFIAGQLLAVLPAGWQQGWVHLAQAECWMWWGLTAKYSYMPSNTGQSDSPGAPMLNRFSWVMYSCVVSGVTCFIKLM